MSAYLYKDNEGELVAVRDDPLARRRSLTLALTEPLYGGRLVPGLIVNALIREAGGTLVEAHGMVRLCPDQLAPA